MKKKTDLKLVQAEQQSPTAVAETERLKKRREVRQFWKETEKDGGSRAGK